MHVYVDLFHVYQQQWSSIIIGKRLECLREYVNPWASPRDHLYAATICKSKDEVVGLISTVCSLFICLSIRCNEIVSLEKFLWSKMKPQ